jgi:ketosteroid isomerase-like protein
MTQQTAGSLGQRTERFFELVDQLDVTAIVGELTEDAQSVDEISRSWLRGRDAIGAYLDQLTGTVSDVRSRLTDIHVSEWDAGGIVTCVLEQSYMIDGQQQQISAPTSFTYRRVDDDWKLALFHSVPLPEEPQD